MEGDGQEEQQLLEQPETSEENLIPILKNINKSLNLITTDLTIVIKKSR